MAAADEGCGRGWSWAGIASPDGEGFVEKEKEFEFYSRYSGKPL